MKNLFSIWSSCGSAVMVGAAVVFVCAGLTGTDNFILGFLGVPSYWYFRRRVFI